MIELNEYLVYEKYIDKRTKEKVIAVKGKSLIDMCIRGRGILRYAENKYLNLNAVSHIKFLEEGIIIENGVFQKGFEKSKTEHYDKIKELIKNYVEE